MLISKRMAAQAVMGPIHSFWRCPELGQMNWEGLPWAATQQEKQGAEKLQTKSKTLPYGVFVFVCDYKTRK